eukprot:TRINITY_DN91249_c0_g1_i1.p1 TRINITY_DN91249_c0_g1~~TRINITY_DN91249_c0_g1_i1.p1  ORF type:complete len:488 (+),score=47.11 TRINITY_DN91249_c0_g1_i1:39-1502(+)
MGPFVTARMWLLCTGLLGRVFASMKHCCRDQQLVVGMPPTTYFPFVIYNGVPSSAHDQPAISSYTGFVPEVLEELSLIMGFNLKYVTMHDVASYALVAGAYIDNLTAGDIDVVSMWPDGGEAKMPIVMSPLFLSQYTGLVQKTVEEQPFWGFVGPFSWQLWICLIATIFGYSLAFLAIRFLDPDEDESCRSLLRPSSLARTAYHMWIALFGGEDYEWTTGPGRMLRFSLLFFVMLTTATYTANLAAFFVVPAVKLHGPSDMDSLRNSKACYTTKAFGNLITPFVSSLVFPPDRVNSFEDQMRYCYDLLQDGKIDVLVEGLTILPKYALDHCDGSYLQRSIAFGEYYFSLAFDTGEKGIQWYKNITSAMPEVTGTTTHTQNLNHWFAKGLSCPKDEAGNLAKLTAHSMGGTLVVSGIFAVVAVAIAAGKRMRSTTSPVQSVEHVGRESWRDATETSGEMLKKVLQDLHDLKKKVGDGDKPELHLAKGA